MPRYVILEHDWPERHWDLMLEAGSVLETWKLSSPPNPGATLPVEKSFDHRLMYLDYEGPISKGRGSVTRWDSGTYEPMVKEENRRVVSIQGFRLQGKVEIAVQNDSSWTFSFSGP